MVITLIMFALVVAILTHRLFLLVKYYRKRNRGSRNES